MSEARGRSIDDRRDPFPDRQLEGKETRRGDLKMAAFGDRERLARRRRAMRVVEDVMDLVRRRIGEERDEQGRGG